MKSQINLRESNKKCILGDWVAAKWKNLMDQFRSILNKKKSGFGGDLTRMPQTSGNSMVECPFLRHSSVTDSKLQR